RCGGCCCAPPSATAPSSPSPGVPPSPWSATSGPAPPSTATPGPWQPDLSSRGGWAGDRHVLGEDADADHAGDGLEDRVAAQQTWTGTRCSIDKIPSRRGLGEEVDGGDRPAGGGAADAGG